METVSFLTDAFALFLHLPKNKGASGSRDGWYPGLITTNASLQNKFEEEGATGSSSSEADAMLSRLGSRPDYIANFSLATETNPLKIKLSITWRGIQPGVPDSARAENPSPVWSNWARIFSAG